MQQHRIHNCYLRAWLEPVTPTGQKAAIWRIPVRGNEPGEAYRRSADKSFRSPDVFTVTLEDGTKSYHLEQALGRLESDFTQILQHIRRDEELTVLQRMKLAMFTAAMMGRSKSHTEHMQSQLTRVADQVEALERARGVKLKQSTAWRNYIEGMAPDLVIQSVKNATPFLFSMQQFILTANDELGFITSDAPCVMYNPKSHTFPPFYRSPGLAQKDVEIILPLTPQHLLAYRHGVPVARTVEVSQATVDEMNRYQVFFAGEEIVSWKGETRPAWFAKREPPSDAWEHTPEGKAAMAMKEEVAVEVMPAPTNSA
jgi:Protein of unknown function (DUF4238)